VDLVSSYSFSFLVFVCLLGAKCDCYRPDAHLPYGPS
jgi:hypothetical protein